MTLLLGVLAFLGAFLAEYLHDRWAIQYTKLITANVPPWTRREAMRKRVQRAMGRTFLLSMLSSFDLLGAVQWKLPVWAICLGAAAGSQLAVWKMMWEDWQEARSRMYDATGKRKNRAKESDDQQAVDDSEQIGLL